MYTGTGPCHDIRRKADRAEYVYETEIRTEDGNSISVLTMGPICITTELKRQGYGKSGFKHASEFGIRYHGMESGEEAAFFLCKELIPGYLDGAAGEYETPKGYYVDEKEVEEFDKLFPAKEKKKLPGQLWGE